MKNNIILWLVSCTAVFFVSPPSFINAVSLIIPLLIVFACISICNYANVCRLSFPPYLLFFSISLTTLFGFTEILTGSHSEGTGPMLFGLSFYTASLAFLIVSQKKIKYIESLKIANPLMLITGPIALFIKPINSMRLLNRVNYYLPFVIVGIFLFRVIAMPLTDFFFLIEHTDIVSAIIFAIIFEIFVYANFCGLSLIVYGLFGLLGYKIPLNFRQPFSSSNILEFWKGWHTSLSVVLKVLFYAPIRRYYPQFIALLSVFMASALWHGVSINFIIWGAFHALLYWGSARLLKLSHKLLPAILLLFGVVFGRLLFVESETERLFEKLIFVYDGISVFGYILRAPNLTKISLLLGGMLIFIEFFFQKNSYVRKRNYKYLRTPISLTILVFLTLLLISNIWVEYAVYGQR